MHIFTTRKKQNCCHHGTFPGLKTIKIVFATGTPPRTPTGSLQCSPDPLAGFRGRKGKEEGKEKGQARKGRISGREGERKGTGRAGG